MKGLPRHTQNRNFTAVFDDRTSFRAKGLPQHTQNRNFSAGFGNRTSFRAKGLRPSPQNRNCMAVFGDRTSFRAEGFRFALPRAFKREIEKKERARRQESKRARENVKM